MRKVRPPSPWRSAVRIPAPALLGIVLLSLLLTDLHPAEANPGFARRFGFSCTMCHVGFPKLNSFGEDFAANGYQMPGQNLARITESFGDPKLFLEKNMSLGIRVDSFLRYRNDTDVRTDIEVPFLAKIFASTYLMKDVTFYFYFLFNEAGEVSGVEDAFFYFNNMIGGRDFDLLLGQFQVMDIVYAREQRLTFQDIPAYTTAVSDSGFNLTYHRGAILTYGGPLDLAAGVVNGNGIGPADTNENFDNNSYKDPFGRIGFSLGDAATIGWYGFLGEDNEILTPTGFGEANRFYRHGPDLRIQAIPKIDIRSQWLMGRDDNPDYLATEVSKRIQSGFVEINYLYSPDWIAVGLYNWYDAEHKNDLDRNLLTANLTRYLARNFKVFGEYTHDLQSTTASHPHKNLTGVLGLVAAF